MCGLWLRMRDDDINTGKLALTQWSINYVVSCYHQPNNITVWSMVMFSNKQMILKTKYITTNCVCIQILSENSHSLWYSFRPISDFMNLHWRIIVTKHGFNPCHLQRSYLTMMHRWLIHILIKFVMEVS